MLHLLCSIDFIGFKIDETCDNGVKLKIKDVKFNDIFTSFVSNCEYTEFANTCVSYAILIR